MAKRARKRRIPKLLHTKTRNIGWHVSYRDPETGVPRKERFGNIPKAEAEKAYHKWVASWLSDDPRSAGNQPRGKGKRSLPEPSPLTPSVKVTPGSLLHVTSGYLKHEGNRARKPGEPRRPGTIAAAVVKDRTKHARDFLAFLNERHGPGAVARMKLADLLMVDVEAYNQKLVADGYSSTQVSKRLQVVKSIIDRAGRPEHGGQVLPWNWDSRDVLQGAPVKHRTLPSLSQLKKLLDACDGRGRAMVWLGIGLGLGQSDLAAVRVGHIDMKSYDLRRGKTGIERYGDTPRMVWNALGDYLRETPRSGGALLFVTKKGFPLVHGRGDAVQQWWNRLRKEIGESKNTLGGFYILRHLGATEFGSRDGCSVSAMKRWLGHSASSSMADVYMRPVAPEYRELIDWVRKALATGVDGWNGPRQEQSG